MKQLFHINCYASIYFGDGEKAAYHRMSGLLW